MRAAVVAAFALMAAAPVGTAFAEEPEHADYDRGVAHYRNGDYAAALADFTDAYVAMPSNALLFNIAQAHRMLGHSTEALTFYRRYVDEAAPSPVRDDAERFVEALVREQRPAEPLVMPPPPPPRPIAAPVEHRRMTRNGAVALVASTGGIGIALVSIGAGLALHARDTSQALEGTPLGSTWTETYRGRYEDGQASSQASTAMFVLGAGAIATSVASAVVFRRAFHERPLRASGPLRWTF
jgi:hypothetical protein